MNPTRPAIRQHPRRAGFTLLELMISLAVGGVAITSVYTIGATSTRHFHKQQMVANTQTAVRNAMNQVKKDIARAGYLATPWGNVGCGLGQCVETCGPVSADFEAPNSRGKLAAIARYARGVAVGGAGLPLEEIPLITELKTMPNSLATGANVDRISLMANYGEGNEYPGLEAGNPPNITDVAVGQNWQAFRKDFTDWAVSDDMSYDADLFKAEFLVNRLIRIRTTSGHKHFARVTGHVDPGAPGDDPHIQFLPAVPTNCADGVDQGWISPVHLIGYQVEAATDADEVARFQAANGAVTRLVRTELDPRNPDFGPPNAPRAVPLAGAPPSRSVLDYVVNFQVSFRMNTVPFSLTADPPAADNVPVAVTNAPGAINNRPEQVRSATITLSARTPEQDPRHPLVGAPITAFQVFDNLPGAARVRTLRSTVLIPNVAYAGY